MLLSPVVGASHFLIPQPSPSPIPEPQPNPSISHTARKRNARSKGSDDEAEDDDEEDEGHAQPLNPNGSDGWDLPAGTVCEFDDEEESFIFIPNHADRQVVPLRTKQTKYTTEDLDYIAQFMGLLRNYMDLGCRILANVLKRDFKSVQQHVAGNFRLDATNTRSLTPWNVYQHEFFAALKGKNLTTAEKAERARRTYNTIKEEKGVEWDALVKRANEVNEVTKRDRMVDPQNASLKSYEDYCDSLQDTYGMAGGEGLVGFGLVGRVPSVLTKAPLGSCLLWCGDLTKSWAEKTGNIKQLEALGISLTNFYMDTSKITAVDESPECYEREVQNDVLIASFRIRFLRMMCDAAPKDTPKQTRVQWSSLGDQLITMTVRLILPPGVIIRASSVDGARACTAEQQKLLVEGRRPGPDCCAYGSALSDDEVALLRAFDPDAGSIVLIRSWAPEGEKGRVLVRVRDTNWWENRQDLLDKQTRLNAQPKRSRGRPRKNPAENNDKEEAGQSKKQRKVVKHRRSQSSTDDEDDSDGGDDDDGEGGGDNGEAARRAKKSKKRPEVVERGGSQHLMDDDDDEDGGKEARRARKSKKRLEVVNRGGSQHSMDDDDDEDDGKEVRRAKKSKKQSKSVKHRISQRSDDDDDEEHEELRPSKKSKRLPRALKRRRDHISTDTEDDRDARDVRRSKKSKGRSKPKLPSMPSFSASPSSMPPSVGPLPPLSSFTATASAGRAGLPPLPLSMPSSSVPSSSSTPSLGPMHVEQWNLVHGEGSLGGSVISEGLSGQLDYDQFYDLLNGFSSAPSNGGSLDRFNTYPSAPPNGGALDYNATWFSS